MARRSRARARRFDLRLLLAAALLAAWQIALVHPLAHVDSQGRLMHVPGSHPSKSSSDKNSQNLNCNTVLAVLGCIGGSAAASLTAVEGVEISVAGEDAAHLGASAPAYQSQAPPAFP